MAESVRVARQRVLVVGLARPVWLLLSFVGRAGANVDGDGRATENAMGEASAPLRTGGLKRGIVRPPGKYLLEQG